MGGVVCEDHDLDPIPESNLLRITDRLRDAMFQGECLPDSDLHEADWNIADLNALVELITGLWLRHLSTGLPLAGGDGAPARRRHDRHRCAWRKPCLADVLRFGGRIEWTEALRPADRPTQRRDSLPDMGYVHLELETRIGVGWLWLARPQKHNALSADMWEEIPQALAELTADEEVRAIVVAGRGPSFTVGIDIDMLASLQFQGDSQAEKNMALYRKIRDLQGTMSSFAECAKPVIAAVHGYCLGAGVDLITACDIRLASRDAVFSVRETKLALVADVGTLQRLPSIVGPGHAAELAYTGGDIDADQAERIGLINRVQPDSDALLEAAQRLGESIASNSPLAVQGTKAVLGAGAELSTDRALDHVALWHTAFLHSNDLNEALTSFTERRPPRFTGT
jgi:enoyl-CoA hydratase